MALTLRKRCEKHGKIGEIWISEFPISRVNSRQPKIISRQNLPLLKEGFLVLTKALRMLRLKLPCFVAVLAALADPLSTLAATEIVAFLVHMRSALVNSPSLLLFARQ